MMAASKKAESRCVAYGVDAMLTSRLAFRAAFRSQPAGSGGAPAARSATYCPGRVKASAQRARSCKTQGGLGVQRAIKGRASRKQARRVPGDARCRDASAPAAATAAQRAGAASAQRNAQLRLSRKQLRLRRATRRASSCTLSTSVRSDPSADAGLLSTTVATDQTSGAAEALPPYSAPASARGAAWRRTRAARGARGAVTSDGARRSCGASGAGRGAAGVATEADAATAAPPPTRRSLVRGAHRGSQITAARIGRGARDCFIGTNRASEVRGATPTIFRCSLGFRCLGLPLHQERYTNAFQS